MEKVSLKASVPCMEGGSGSDNYAHNSLLQNYNFQAFAKPHLSYALDHFARLFFLHYLRDGFTANHSAGAHSQSLHESPCEHADTLLVSPHDALPRETGAPLDNAIDRCLAHVARLTVADFGCSYGRNTLDYAAFIVQGLYDRLKGKIALDWPDGDAPPLQVELQYFFSDLPSNNFNSLLQSLEPFLQEQLECCDEGAAAAVPLKWKLFSGAVAGSFHGRLFPSGSLHLAISAYSVQWLSQGLITKEERDMFNIPFYVCHKSEMEEAIGGLSNKFKMVKLEVLRDCSNLPKEEEQKIKGSSQAFGKFVANFVASLLKPMLQEYLGESRANKLFQRLYNEATKKAYLSTSISYEMLIVVIEKL